MSAGNDLLLVKLDGEVVKMRSSQEENERESESDRADDATKSRKKRKAKKKKPPSDTILIPFVWDIVPVIDLENRRIEIEPPPGLIDLRM